MTDIANTSLGSLRGVILENARVWRRVPFAEPPLGPRRWSPPVPKLAWQGLLDATTFGPACSQPPGFDPPILNTSEDCLTMAIYAPREPSQLNPILAYFHGGSFLNGGAAEARLDATRLVESYGGRVVVAIVQYRLGVLGFLGAEALRGRGGDTATGNYGVQDQRLSLHFLREHAAAFGGDPSRITIAGQSAGAGCVSVHVISPRSAGLFERAAMWSGAIPDWVASHMPMQEAVFSAIAKRLCSGRGHADASDVTCLERTDATALVAAAQDAIGAVCSTSACLQPTIDGVELTDEPRRLYSALVTATVSNSTRTGSSALASQPVRGSRRTHASHNQASQHRVAVSVVPLLVGAVLDEVPDKVGPWPEWARMN